jgi:short-subunit dehydrogenase
MTQPVCVVTGVGPGTGSALSRRFTAGGYRVAMLARNAARLTALERELPGARLTFAASARFSTSTPPCSKRNFRVNAMGLLHAVRRLAPAMMSAGKGAIVVTGNTSALRGKAGFAGFAPTKAAQRILAEAMARDLGPKGVHVAYMVIDAVIDVPWTRERFKDKADDFFIKPAAIAEEAWHVVHQDRSAWSFNVEIRPFHEPW